MRKNLILVVFAMFLCLNLTGMDMHTVIFETSYGEIEVILHGNRAPVTVENFIKYIKDGFYDGLIFHRVMEDFVVQGGGFYPDMIEKKPLFEAIENEASISRMSNTRGSIAMARTSNPNSATSQFYINLTDNSRLDWDKYTDGYGYCVFGFVNCGMEVVDSISKVQTEKVGVFSDVPTEDIIIIRAYLVE